MNLIIIFVLVLNNVCSIFGQAQFLSPFFSGNSCRTPTSNIFNGNCVSIPQCHSLYQILIKPPISEENAQYLRESQCGTGSDNKPMVCCPFNQVAQFQFPISSPQVYHNPVSNASPQYSRPVPESFLEKLPASCGAHKKNVFIDIIDTRVVGGLTAELNEYPWMALLQYIYPKTGEKSFNCGGMLINKNYVVTAAHCLVDIHNQNISLFNVRLGEHDYSSEKDCRNGLDGERHCNNPRDYRVNKTIIHEGYDPNDDHQFNDIALLRLDRPVEFNEFVQPICLPLDQRLKAMNFTGNLMSIAGWGRTESGEKSPVKLKLDVKVVSKSFCKEAHKNAHQNVAFELRNTQICAGGDKNQAACFGDSGGPLMFKDENKWYLYGVVSFGSLKCGTEGKPGVYTKVSEYINWINSNMEP